MSNNLKKICGDFEISGKLFCKAVDQFNDNIEFYLNEKDRDIIHYVTEAEKTYEDSLQGKLPQPKVQIP